MSISVRQRVELCLEFDRYENLWASYVTLRYINVAGSFSKGNSLQPKPSGYKKILLAPLSLIYFE